MPFVDSDRTKLLTVELGQAPLAAPTFQLRRRFGYYEETDDGSVPDEGGITWADAHVPSDHPGPGNRTDLASVPAIFWGVIASYGRQTAPAVLHDSECWKVRVDARARLITPTEALGRRERIDRAFRLGLRELAVPPFMAWLMWTFVSLERYQKHSIPRFLAMIALGALGLGLVVGSVVALIVGLAWPVALLMLILPVATSAVAGRHWRLQLWLAYAGALMVPVAVFSVLAYLPFLVVENLAWFVIDRPKSKGSPVVGPVDVKNIQRSATG